MASTTNSESSPCSMTLRLYSERRFVDFGKPGFARQLEEVRPERRGKGEDHARIMQIFVDQLVEHPHAVTKLRLLRHQRRRWERLIQVIKDQRGFDDRAAVVHQRRHDTVRVELQIGRIELVPAQGEEMFLGVEAFLDERNAHLLRADRIDIVVMLEHSVLPPPSWQDGSWSRCGPKSRRRAASAGPRL